MDNNSEEGSKKSEEKEDNALENYSDDEDKERDIGLIELKNKVKHKKAVRELSAACYYNNFREVKTTIANYQPTDDWINNQIPKDEITKSKDLADSKTTCLCIACRYSSILIVKYLVKHGASVGLLNSSGNTPLHRACRSDIDTLEKVIFLMKLDPLPLKIRNSGKTPLHVACRFASVEVVRELVSNGAPIGFRDSNSDLPFHIAALSGIDRKEKIDFFLQKRPDFVNVPSRGAKTLMHIAAQVHTIERVQELIDQGAKLDVEDQFGNTPLHRACGSDVDAFKKVELFVSKNKELFKKKNKRESTPLHVACQEGTFEIVKYFIEKGADGNALDEDKDMALARACMSKVDRKEKVSYLVERYSSQIHHRNKHFNQPIHIAVWLGHNDAVKILLERKSDINAIGNRKRTPLHMAAEQGLPDTLQLLLNNGADKSARTKEILNFTPLHSSANLGHRDCVQILLDNGADVNLRDTRGNTALHHAAYFEKTETVRTLATNDSCDIRIKNDKGALAIQYATKYDYTDEDIEKREIQELQSVYGVLRKLDIDWKKAEALASSVNHHSVRLTKELIAEDHVHFLHERCILTKKEKQIIDETVGSENKIRTLLYTLMDKEDAYWAPFFLQSLKNTPRAASCAVMVEATSERPTFYRPAPPAPVPKNSNSEENTTEVNSQSKETGHTKNSKQKAK